MSGLIDFLSANPIALFGLSVLLQVSLVTVFALVIARTLTKSAVVRWWVLGSALTLVLASPLTTYVAQQSNASWLKFTSSNTTKTAQVNPDESTSRAMPPGDTTFSSEQPFASPVVTPPANADAELSAAIALPPQPSSSQVSTNTLQASRSDIQPTAMSIEAVLYRVIQILLIVWIVGTAFLLAKMARSWRLMASLVQQSKSVDEGPLVGCLSAACKRVGLADQPRLLRNRDIHSPMAAGIFRFAILIPEDLPNVVDQDALCDVLTHEAAHIARRDPLVALLQSVSRCVFWFHPMVRIVNRDLSKAREEICDNYVLKATSPTIYSRTLLQLAELMMPRQEYPVAVGMLDDWKLECRVADLLDGDRNRETGVTRRSLSSVVFILALLVVIGWAGTINVGHADDSAGDTTLVAKPDSGAEAIEVADNPSVPKSPTTEFRFAGKVVDADDQPVEGAEIHFSKRDAEVLAVSDAAGRFNFICRKADLPNGAQWGRLKFVATAEGHGLGIVQGLRFEATGKGLEDLQARNPNKNFSGLKKFKPILRMERNSIPLRGTIVDLEGNPVPDVTMQVRIVDNTYARFAFDAVKTDAEGRFEIQNIGDGRTARLVAKGKDTAFSVLFARTDRKKTETKSQGDGFDPFSLGTKAPVRNRVIYGADFTHAVGPSVPVKGIVTDKESGAPVVGANVYVYRLPNNDEYDRREEFFCTTDEKGRYELNGLPVGSSGLYATPPKDSAYLPAGKQIRISENSESTINGDFHMTQGILLRGRVVNQKTGNGVKGFVDYSAQEGNEYFEKAKGFQQTAELYQYPTDINGAFQLPVLPGAGYIAIHAQGGGYTTGVVSKGAADDLDRTPGPFLPTKPVLMIPGSYHYVQKITVKPGKPVEKVKIELAPGQTVNVNFVDVDGNPVKNVEVEDTVNYRSIGRGFSHQVRSGVYKMQGYTPANPRNLVMRVRAKNLAAVARYEEVIKGDVTVTLEQAGTIKGRVVTKNGKPKVVTIDGYERPFQTGRDGSFQLNVVPAGAPVRLTARVNGRPIGEIFNEESVGAGEIKDLGDLVVKEFGQ